MLANGDVVTAERSSVGKNHDLYAAAAGSLGTLGIVTLLTVRLVPAKPFVKLVYTPCGSISETVKRVQDVATVPTLASDTAADSVDFVNAILFSPEHGVLMTGRVVDDAPANQPRSKTLRFSRPWDPWFYLHVQSLPTDKPSVDYMPLAEYLFRYDRGAFWMGRHAFDYFSVRSPLPRPPASSSSSPPPARPLLSVPFNRLMRYALDDFLHARTLFRALQVADGNPLRSRSLPMLNVGLWGAVPGVGSVPGAGHNEAWARLVNREIEARVGALGGRKVLYSATYYTDDEFWAIYSAERDAYDVARKRWGAERCLPTVWDKVGSCQAGKSVGTGVTGWLMKTWPFEGMMALFGVIWSGEWRLHRNTTWMVECSN